MDVSGYSMEIASEVCLDVLDEKDGQWYWVFSMNKYVLHEIYYVKYAIHQKKDQQNRLDNWERRHSMRNTPSIIDRRRQSAILSHLKLPMRRAKKNIVWDGIFSIRQE